MPIRSRLAGCGTVRDAGVLSTRFELTVPQNLKVEVSLTLPSPTRDDLHASRT